MVPAHHPDPHVLSFYIEYKTIFTTYQACVGYSVLDNQFWLTHYCRLQALDKHNKTDWEHIDKAEFKAAMNDVST